MKVLHSVVFLCIIGFVAANVASEFEAAQIKPDIIKDAPNSLITVKYGGKSVSPGDELTPTEVKHVPEIHYEHEGGVLYTLVMTDPDVPNTRGYNREFQHWVVGNIPEDSVAKGEVLTAYVGSGPPKGSGLHRYIFLLYKQNQGAITFDERRLSSRDGTKRRRFSVQKFAEKYDLEGPIAGNYFKAQYDDYVPTVHRQLGFF
ncbi:protein D2-like [Athalia rosae]|uniref:protein D2-like n=1 Tax=Athalia rosae TaxID=37344 RepID=UPI0020345336|nr:protein D2-like [Athalia rosae]